MDRDNFQDSWPTNTGVCAQLAGASLRRSYPAGWMSKVLLHITVIGSRAASRSTKSDRARGIVGGSGRFPG